MIRLPDIQGLQGTALNEPQVNPRVAGAPAAALGVVAESIAKVSDQFHDTALRVQKLENGRMISAKRSELAAGYAALQLELQSDPDPASRLKRVEEFLANSKGAMDGADMPPAVRDELVAHHDDFATRARIRQGEDSARLAMKRAGQQFQNEFDAAGNAGDRPAAERSIRTAQDSGVLLPEEGTAAMTKFDQVAAEREQERFAAANPLAAEKELADPDYLKNHPNLTPESHDRLTRATEHHANRFRSDFVNDLIIQGAEPSEEDVAEMERLGVIDKSTHARMVTRIRSAVVPANDPAIYNEVYGQIAAYDPAKDPTGRVEATLRAGIGSAALPPDAIKELNERLTKRANPADAKKPKSVHESAFASKIGVDFNRGDWGKFRFPIDHDNNPDTAPILRVTREEYDKAWKLRGQFTDQWRAILDTLPDDAPFDAVNAAYESLKKTYADKKPVPDLKFSPREKPAFDPEATYRKTTPQGNFGGQVIQPPGLPYKGAAVTVFGGPNDPNDSGVNAMGKKTGDGGVQGAAIPETLLKAKFPGKDKKWFEENVRIVVTDPGGVVHSMLWADYGTAESVWNDNARPTVDLTEGAVRQMGGQVTYTKDGKLSGVKGLDALDFSVVSIDTGKDLNGLSWEEAKTAWFQTNPARSYEAASNALVALRDAWHEANSGPGVLPPKTRKPMEEAAIIDANTRIAESANY